VRSNNVLVRNEKVDEQIEVKFGSFRVIKKI